MDHPGEVYDRFRLDRRYNVTEMIAVKEICFYPSYAGSRKRLRFWFPCDSGDMEIFILSQKPNQGSPGEDRMRR